MAKPPVRTGLLCQTVCWLIPNTQLCVWFISMNCCGNASLVNMYFYCDTPCTAQPIDHAYLYHALIHTCEHLLQVCQYSSKLVKNPWVHGLNKGRLYLCRRASSSGQLTVSDTIGEIQMFTAVAPSHNGGTIYRLMYHNSVAIGWIIIICLFFP